MLYINSNLSYSTCNFQEIDYNNKKTLFIYGDERSVKEHSIDR